MRKYKKVIIFAFIFLGVYIFINSFDIFYFLEYHEFIPKAKSVESISCVGCNEEVAFGTTNTTVIMKKIYSNRSIQRLLKKAKKWTSRM